LFPLTHTNPTTPAATSTAAATTRPDPLLTG
jgi:hypothetical protein